MSSSQDVSSKGRKKALLIAVRKVKEIDVPLPRTHYDIRELKELLINQYGYAENDIVMLLDDGKLDRPFWSSDVNIVKNIKWLVEDLREDDRLVFYYSGHGGQTICRHDSEVDGRDEVIYGFNGRKIVDNTLKQELVDPVLKTKGCHLFTLFDCCHSETILDLKHCNCYSRLLPPVKSSTISSQTGGTDVTLPLPNKWLWFSNSYPVALPISMSPRNKNVLFISPWSVIGLANRALGHLCNRIARMLRLRSFFKNTQSSVNEPSQTAPVRQPISVNTVLVSPPHLLMSPHGTVTSPISIYQNARCNGICTVTEEEENQGRVVCLSACKDSELAHDDNNTGGTFTKFVISSLQSDSGISYRDLLGDIQSQIIDLQARAAMQGRPFDRFQARRQFEFTSESDSSLVRRKGSTQEPRISSNRPFDWNKKVSI